MTPVGKNVGGGTINNLPHEDSIQLYLYINSQQKSPGDTEHTWLLQNKLTSVTEVTDVRQTQLSPTDRKKTLFYKAETLQRTWLQVGGATGLDCCH